VVVAMMRNPLWMLVVCADSFGAPNLPLETDFGDHISHIEPAGPGLLPVSIIESEDTHHVRIDRE
jgi:hypothetical protein